MSERPPEIVALAAGIDGSTHEMHVSPESRETNAEVMQVVERAFGPDVRGTAERLVNRFKAGVKEVKDKRDEIELAALAALVAYGGVTAKQAIDAGLDYMEQANAVGQTAEVNTQIAENFGQMPHEIAQRAEFAATQAQALGAENLENMEDMEAPAINIPQTTLGVQNPAVPTTKPETAINTGTATATGTTTGEMTQHPQPEETRDYFVPIPVPPPAETVPERPIEKPVSQETDENEGWRFYKVKHLESLISIMKSELGMTDADIYKVEGGYTDDAIQVAKGMLYKNRKHGKQNPDQPYQGYGDDHAERRTDVMENLWNMTTMSNEALRIDNIVDEGGPVPGAPESRPGYDDASWLNMQRYILEDSEILIPEDWRDLLEDTNANSTEDDSILVQDILPYQPS